MVWEILFLIFFLEEIDLLKVFPLVDFFQSGYVDLHFTKNTLKNT